MSEPGAYEPTRIRRLHVRGYRSIRELTLEDLPPIVVLHGENGAGKSNILRAMSLPIRWLGSDLRVAATREDSTRLDYVSADAQLGIRQIDFFRSGGHEIEIGLEIDLGTRTRKKLSEIERPATLEITAILQDVGDGIRLWFPRSSLNSHGRQIALSGVGAQEALSSRQQLEALHARLASAQKDLQTLYKRLDLPPTGGPPRAQLVGEINATIALGTASQAEIDRLQRAYSGVGVLADRLRSRLLRRELLNTSDAYRRIVREAMSGNEFDVDPGLVTSPEQIQRRLYLLATSSDPKERAVPQKLANRFAQALNHAATPDRPLEIAAVRNAEFREYETQLTRGGVEAIPLTSLGTGEQQLLILLLDVLVSSAPIVQIEEPEAHLHKHLMLRLASMLERVVAEHDVDQLFLATHHHAFAIAPTYYDVTYDDEHGTQAVPTNRAKAIQHFYEPGPLWDALRSLVESGLRDDAILFRDEEGRPVRASEVLASIRDEGALAKKFAEEMTKTILLSMREEAEQDAS